MADTTTEAPPAAATAGGSASFATAPDPADPPADGLLAGVNAVWDELRTTVHQRLRLATLELRLAGLTLAQLLVMAVAVALLAVTAWLGLVAAAVGGLVAAGLHWALAVALGVVLNLAAAGWLVRTMLSTVERLDLHATLRRLEGRPASDAGGRDA